MNITYRLTLILVLALVSLTLAACGSPDTAASDEALPDHCIFQTSRAEGQAGRVDLQLILYGEGRTSADVFRAGSDIPIAPSGMYSKEFIDTGDPYVDQTYNERDWEPGQYRIAFEGSGDEHGERTVELEAGIELRVDINCP